MDLAWFEQVVSEALDEVPPAIAAHIDNLVVVVQEEPSRDQDPHGEGLLGLYEGVSLAERGIDYFGVLPDTITVFRGPHLRLHLPELELRAEIRTTVLHEVGHHLGIDDHRLHELGWA
jgi:predicted Zn-dependent protease with MMP-like domain